MLSSFLSWLLGLFSKEKVGFLFILLFKSGASSVAAYICDNNFQKKAYEFVKELAHRNDLTNIEKAHLFNTKMYEYGKIIGKVLCDSVINCLRELAVNALKANAGK